MRTVQTLIAELIETCKGDAEAARRIGIDPGVFGQLKRGTRAVSPEVVAAMCDVLELPGVETQRLAALAVIENPKNATKRGVLRRAFFGCWVLGVVALSGLATIENAYAGAGRHVDALYIVACL